MQTSKYPLVEVFASMQGEGVHTGRPMTFVRFAGCNVGRAPEPSVPGAFDIINNPEIGSGYTICESVFGQRFGCDTNYHTAFSAELNELVTMIVAAGNDRICFTGGEPMIQDLEPLIEAIKRQNGLAKFHVETSGTVEIPNWMWMDPNIWVALSPKKATLPGNIHLANELRLLVTESMGDHSQVAATLHNWLVDMNARTYCADEKNRLGLPKDIYICPVNETTEVLGYGSEFALQIARRLDCWDARVNVQLHKILNMR